MAKKSVRQRLIAGLRQVDAHVRAGRYEAAQSVLAALRKQINGGDPNHAARTSAVLDAHEARVADLLRTANQPLPPNATCTRCGTAFHRDNDKIKVCDICRGPAPSKSVRTVTGGLPGLGRRR